MKNLMNFLIFMFFFSFLGFAKKAIKVRILYDKKDTTLIKKEDKKDSLLYGIDVSHYQGAINWACVGTDTAISFVIIRATMGEKQDERFKHNLQSANSRGFIIGVYHYFDPNKDARMQARNFISNVHRDDLHLRPIVDIEKLNRQKNKDKLVRDLKTYISLIEEHYGMKPIIYTYLNFYYLNLSGRIEDDYDYWIAAYNESCESDVFDIAHIWQCSCTHRLSGINHAVDFNHTYESNLDKLLVPKKDTIKINPL